METEKQPFYKRTDKGIQTPTSEKKDTASGIWYKAPSGNIVYIKELKSNLHVVPDDDYHVRIGSKEYFEIFFDNNEFKELNAAMEAKDPLAFEDTKKYSQRIKDAQEKTGLKDAIRTAVGKSLGEDLMVAAMDFVFVGGSMGSVVGEKICRACDYCLEHQVPLLIISKSGGARMQEAPFSLMQMVRTCAKLTELSKAGIPYISLCTDPTTGGVTASFAMLGDINIAEPGALVGFAGPRVISQTTNIKQEDFPKGFQTAEYLLENGFLDNIIHRKNLKEKLNLYLDLVLNRKIRTAAED